MPWSLRAGRARSSAPRSRPGVLHAGGQAGRHLAAAAAARSVASTAESLARDYARRARGAGRNWDEVAAALKFDAAGHDDPSVEAFLWVAPTPSQRFDSIVTSWECANCAARIADRGPFGGHPEEVERATSTPAHAAPKKTSAHIASRPAGTTRTPSSWSLLSERGSGP